MEKGWNSARPTNSCSPISSWVGSEEVGMDSMLKLKDEGTSVGADAGVMKFNVVIRRSSESGVSTPSRDSQSDFTQVTST